MGRATFLLIAFIFLAGCAGTAVMDATWDEDTIPQEETYATHRNGSAVEIARGDLSFVDRNFAYIYEAPFRPDPLRDELSEFVLDVAFGLLEVAITSKRLPIMSAHSTDSLLTVWPRKGAVSLGPTTAMNLALQDRSQPFQCYLTVDKRLLIPIDSKPRMGVRLRDVCHDNTSRTMV